MFGATVIVAALLAYWIPIWWTDTASWWWLPGMMGMYIGQFGRWVWVRWLRS